MLRPDQLMDQAWKTAVDYLVHIDDDLEKRGYKPAERIALLPGMIQAAAQDYHTGMLIQQMERDHQLRDEANGAALQLVDAINGLADATRKDD